MRLSTIDEFFHSTMRSATALSVERRASSVDRPHGAGPATRHALQRHALQRHALKRHALKRQTGRAQVNEAIRHVAGRLGSGLVQMLLPAVSLLTMPPASTTQPVLVTGQSVNDHDCQRHQT